MVTTIQKSAINTLTKMKKQLKPYTKADYHVTREENKRERKSFTKTNSKQLKKWQRELT